MRISRVIVPILFAAGLLGGLVQPAAAAVVTHRFKLAGTNACLDAGIGSGEVGLAMCGPGDRQLWRWSTPSIETTLRHVGSGACAYRVRTVVGLSDCDGAVSKRWKVTGTPANLVIKAADTGDCLGRTDSVRIGMRPCDGSVSQRWQRA